MDMHLFPRAHTMLRTIAVQEKPLTLKNDRMKWTNFLPKQLMFTTPHTFKSFFRGSLKTILHTVPGTMYMDWMENYSSTRHQSHTVYNNTMSHNPRMGKSQNYCYLHGHTVSKVVVKQSVEILLSISEWKIKTVKITSGHGRRRISCCSDKTHFDTEA